MRPKVLSPEKIAVLDALIAQRIEREGHVFEYDSTMMRKYLNKTGASKKYLITPDLQCRIILGLSQDDHVIDMDTIINAEFINSFRSAQDPDYMPDESMPKFFWLNNTSWAYESIQLNGMISIEKAYAMNGDAIFIRMTKDDIARLTGDYIASHIVCLRFDKDSGRLDIKLDENQDWKTLDTFYEGSTPYKIISYAWDRAGERITLERLCNEGVITEMDAKKYMSSIFQRKSLRNLHTDILNVERRSITLRKRATYTCGKLSDLQSQLDNLDIF